LNPKLLLAKSGKTCLAITLSDLELISTNFGATLVFKVLSNLLLKILLENGQNPPYLAFILQFKICWEFGVDPLIKVIEN
jgi:hypothetical protein